MPNVAKVFREEIQRLARREVRAGLSGLKRDNIRLKKSVADLRGQLAGLARESRDLQKTVAPVVAERESQATPDEAARLRPTAKGISALRRRLGLTQVQLGKLLGVSGQAVVLWEAKEGRVKMRTSTLAAFAGIQSIGKREAYRRLEVMGVPVSARRKARRA
jgi:DNA-binding transcriptional regulator YiaG